MLDLSKVTPLSGYSEDSPEEAQLVNELVKEAHAYLERQEWCLLIKNCFVGIAVGGVLGVFLFELEPKRPQVDPWVWIIVGDLPPAYITTENAPNPACALDGYIGAMEQWVEAARSGGSVEALIPVNTPATSEYAEMLDRRLKFLDREILRFYEEDLKA